MLFSSIIFIILFLPIILIGHTFLPKKLKNLFLLLFSLIFYAWGEGIFVLLMITSIIINYGIGLAIEKLRDKNLDQLTLIIGVIINISFIVYFKYADFIYSSYFDFLGNNTPSNDLNIHLPIGISFFTFQSISYLIDVYRKDTIAQTNPIKIGLYISLFPQLIAGPIVRYTDISKELSKRKLDLNLFTSGINRFIIGLAKKVIIANTLASICDKIFALNLTDFSTPIAWLGIICYTLQIYFDFSGYSDMAIGLGRMLGFKFLENFNFPYIAKSIQDFWRRWHISLSSWFKDYLYIPLGGNRKNNTRTYFNLIVVFFVTGLWHGAGWNFIFWGLFHGFFLILERLFLGKILNKIWSPFSHIYTLLVVMIAWVFFRIEDFDIALEYVFKLFGQGGPFMSIYHYSHFINNYNLMILIIAILSSLKLLKVFHEYINRLFFKIRLKNLLTFFKVLTLMILLCCCLSELATGTHNPFIYFRF